MVMWDAVDYAAVFIAITPIILIGDGSLVIVIRVLAVTPFLDALLVGALIITMTIMNLVAKMAVIILILLLLTMV